MVIHDNEITVFIVLERLAMSGLYFFDQSFKYSERLRHDE